MCLKLLLVILTSYSILLSQQQSTTQQNLKENFAWQIALEAKMFSTGLIDGVWGPKSDRTLKEYLVSEGLMDVQNPRSSEVIKNLLQVDLENVYTTYEITKEDQDQVIFIPEDWNEKAKLPIMNYEALYEVVQGKFRCSKKALARLNPNILPENYTVGTKLTVPLVRLPAKKRIARLEINLTEKILSGFDDNGKRILFIYCSVAKNREKFPGRDAKVINKALNPNYTFNPKYWPEVNNVKQVLIIKPGPKNPVGSAWIGLDLPGYGIHGTPIPDNIGKTGSHGCFRLTNWHAIHLVACVEIGTTVVMSGANNLEVTDKPLNTTESTEINQPPQEENKTEQQQTRDNGQE